MKTKIFLAAAVLAFGVLSPVLALADGDLIDGGAGMTISRMGVGTGADGAAYFDITEHPAAATGCTWGLYYINLSTPAGVATYATLLNMHNRGKKLSRMHFFQTANPGTCSVNLIEVKL